MPTWGFSYLLKILSLNPKPQGTEVRKRFQPSDGGYDFHASVRRLVRRHLEDGVPIDELLASADRIKRVPERESAKAALRRLAKWREAHPGTLTYFDGATLAGPLDFIKIRFQPDFGIILGEQAVAVHLWNTKQPTLSKRMTYAALSWLPAAYKDAARRPDDYAVLSLQDGQLLRLSDWPQAQVVGAGVYADLGRLLKRVREGTASNQLPLPAGVPA